jgi:hypothetical protein
MLKQLLLPIALAGPLFCVNVFCADGTVTFNKDVAPIVFERCSGCHHANDVAPMSLLSYKDARPWAKAIRAAVLSRKMPPWQADPHFGDFVNDRRLTEAQIETIKAWVDAGAPEGDAKDLPPIPHYDEGWRLGPPDLIVQIPKEYQTKAAGPDEYVYFTVPVDLKEDVWIRAVDLHPGNRRIVHHAHVYLENPVEAKTAADPLRKDENPKLTFSEAGLTHIKPDAPVLDDGCSSVDGGEWPGGKAEENGGMLGSYLPGKDPDVFPDGYARKIKVGSKIGFQVHYHPLTDSAQSDRTSVGLYFAKSAPKQVLRRIDIHNYLFKIPPGDPDHLVTACYVFQKDVEFMTYTAHMHLRGKDMRFDAIYPDGRRETLFSVPNYDFNWQNEYKLRVPVSIQKGTKLEIIAHFDNSANNRYNPDPTKTIRWGEPSYEEMMDGWIEFILPEPVTSASK